MFEKVQNIPKSQRGNMKLPVTLTSTDNPSGVVSTLSRPGLIRMMTQNRVRRLQRRPRCHTPQLIYSCCAVPTAPSPGPGSLWEVGRGEQAFPASTAQAGMQDGHVCCRLFARLSMGSELVSERPPNHASGVKASALAEATPPWGAFPCLCLPNALRAQL